MSWPEDDKIKELDKLEQGKLYNIKTRKRIKKIIAQIKNDLNELYENEGFNGIRKISWDDKYKIEFVMNKNTRKVYYGPKGLPLDSLLEIERQHFIDRLLIVLSSEKTKIKKFKR